MNNPPHQDIPEDAEIEKLLSHFRPLPSSRFQKRMESAPWRRTRDSLLSNLLPNNIKSSQFAWAVIIILVILLAGTALVIPQVRVIASQIIYSFISAPSNQIEVQVTPASAGDLFNFSDPSNFPLSIQEAEQQAGFQIKQLSPVPDHLTFLGAHFDQAYRSVILLYHGDNFKLFFTQRLLEDGQDVFSIGEQAQVKLVKIGNLQGELVEGGWKAISTQPSGDLQTTQNPINITAIWDDRLPQSTLRWKSDGMAYELRLIGENRPAQSDIINWANELK